LSLGPLAAVLVLLGFTISTPITISGALYLVGASAAAVGGWRISWGYRKYRAILWLGLGLIIAVIAMRVLQPHDGQIKLLLLPEQSDRCGLNCIFDEQDTALFSTRILALIGGISPTEQNGLLEAMYRQYQAMAKVEPAAPSPFLRTYLNQQRPDAFDAVVIEPDNPTTHTGIIFLHGFTGNFTMPCWLFAQAARAAAGITVCPSVDWRGYWWTAAGKTTLRATIAYLHRRGVNRIYLAGLSNGAVGASKLADELTDDLAGLILISGASANAQDSGLPVLVLAGQNDERMPSDLLRTYADHLGTQATFVELPADHFMLVKNYDEVEKHITAWLQQH
ncbi:MAG TPA: hypothetical protein VHO69_06300, partial [Phototrophicaceae bacterium]|nr:hypothetical protein [Phototrophicaceae bacterium]